MQGTQTGTVDGMMRVDVVGVMTTVDGLATGETQTGTQHGGQRSGMPTMVAQGLGGLAVEQALHPRTLRLVNMGVDLDIESVVMKVQFLRNMDAKCIAR